MVCSYVRKGQLQSMDMLLCIYRCSPILEGPLCVHVRCTDAHAVSSNAVIEHGLQHHRFVLVMGDPL